MNEVKFDNEPNVDTQTPSVSIPLDNSIQMPNVESNMNQVINEIPSISTPLDDNVQMPNMEVPVTNVEPSVIPIQENNQALVEETPMEQEYNGVPTIEQSREEFLNNTQNTVEKKKVEKKESMNYVFYIVLFAAIILAIKFLFPILLRYF